MSREKYVVDLFRESHILSKKTSDYSGEPVFDKVLQHVNSFICKSIFSLKIYSKVLEITAIKLIGF